MGGPASGRLPSRFPTSELQVEGGVASGFTGGYLSGLVVENVVKG